MKDTCSKTVAAAVANLFQRMHWEWGFSHGAHCPTEAEIQREFTELISGLGEDGKWASCGHLRVIKDPEWGITLCVEVGNLLEEET